MMAQQQWKLGSDWASRAPQPIIAAHLREQREAMAQVEQRSQAPQPIFAVKPRVVGAMEALSTQSYLQPSSPHLQQGRSPTANGRQSSSPHIQQVRSPTASGRPASGPVLITHHAERQTANRINEQPMHSTNAWQPIHDFVPSVIPLLGTIPATGNENSLSSHNLFATNSSNSNNLYASNNSNLYSSSNVNALYASNTSIDPRTLPQANTLSFFHPFSPALSPSLSNHISNTPTRDPRIFPQSHLINRVAAAPPPHLQMIYYDDQNHLPPQQKDPQQKLQTYMLSPYQALAGGDNHQVEFEYDYGQADLSELETSLVNKAEAWAALHANDDDHEEENIEYRKSEPPSLRASSGRVVRFASNF